MKAVLVAVAVLAVVLGAAYWLGAQSDGAKAPPAPPTVARDTPPAATEPAAAEPNARPEPSVQAFDVRLQGGLPTPESPTTLRVTQGDAVRITVLADQADELHLHGYDLHLDLQAGQAASLASTAEHAGRFEYELHHSHRVIGALEVYPASR